jgi:CubicO group peptidase (beta-lactamase class C family)
MKENIWEILGMKDMTFWPKQIPDMQNRMATISTLNEQGEGPAVDNAGFDVTLAATDCLGGAGGYGSVEAYFTFLQAVLRREPKLLNDDSWTELFKPQLNKQCKKELNDILKATPMHTQYLGMSLPTEIEKQWSFAGLICETGQKGRMSDGTILWGGVPSMTWVRRSASSHDGNG